LIEYLQILTTTNYSAIVNSHTLQFTTARTNSSQSASSSPVVACSWIPTTCSASVLTFLPAGELESQLCYCRPSVDQFWRKAPIWGLGLDFYYSQTIAALLLWSALSDERTDLSFIIAASSRQHSRSRVRVSPGSWPYFTLSDSRLPQPGGPRPRIYISQEQGDPVIPPGHEFPFICLLQLAGPRWKYSNSPPCWTLTNFSDCPAYNISARTEQKTPFPLLRLRLLRCPRDGYSTTV
jgi:hypothetical protein